MSFWNNVKIANFNLPPRIFEPAETAEESQEKKQGDNVLQKGQNLLQKRPDNIFKFNDLLHLIPKDVFEISHKRLNDNDSEIIKKNLFQYIPDDSLRLELQMENANKNLKETEKRINAVKILSENKDGALGQLLKKKQLIQQEIQAYKTQYRELGFMYKIADMMNDGYTKLGNSIAEIKNKITSHPLALKIKNFCGNLGKNEEMKSVLEKFNILQSSLKDRLMTKSNPFGETDMYFKEYTTLMTGLNKVNLQADKLLAPQAKTGISGIVKNACLKALNILKQVKLG